MPSGAVTTIFPSPRMPSNVPWSGCLLKEGKKIRSPLTDLEGLTVAEILCLY